MSKSKEAKTIRQHRHSCQFSIRVNEQMEIRKEAMYIEAFIPSVTVFGSRPSEEMIKP